METNFSKIESYLGNRLSDSEKKDFEDELAQNSQLAEKFEFFKNIKKKQDYTLTLKEYDKKILPELDEINFTEKKQVKPIRFISLSIAVIGLLVVSLFQYSDKQTLKNAFANIELEKKQLEKDYEQQKLIAIEASQKASSTMNLGSEQANILKEELIQKEKEIALLKKDDNHITDKKLQAELEKLKKELADLKKEYYESKGNFASQNENKTAKEDKFLFLKSKNKLSISWHHAQEYKIYVYDSNNKLISSSKDYILLRWKVFFKEQGLYRIKFVPQSSAFDEMYLIDFKNKMEVWKRY